jgi:hypothetical protein
MPANDRQVGGDHYGLKKVQHWDIVIAFDLDYFQGQITKYVMRWKQKGGIQDLKKAQHFLEKYIESEVIKSAAPQPEQPGAPAEAGKSEPIPESVPGDGKRPAHPYALIPEVCPEFLRMPNGTIRSCVRDKGHAEDHDWV